MPTAGSALCHFFQNARSSPANLAIIGIGGSQRRKPPAIELYLNDFLSFLHSTPKPTYTPEWPQRQRQK
jgi:hypothetical protein